MIPLESSMRKRLLSAMTKRPSAATTIEVGPYGVARVAGTVGVSASLTSSGYCRNRPIQADVPKRVVACICDEKTAIYRRLLQGADAMAAETAEPPSPS